MTIKASPKISYDRINNGLIEYILVLSDYWSSFASPAATSSSAKIYTKYEKHFKNIVNNSLLPFVQRNTLNLKNLAHQSTLNDNQQQLNQSNPQSVLVKKQSESEPQEHHSFSTAKTVFLNYNLNRIKQEKLLKLCDSINKASSSLIKKILINDLFKVLYEDPDMRHIIYRQKRNLIQTLIDIRNNAAKEKNLVGSVNECLALLGHVDQTSIKHKGVNILSLDGGGTVLNILAKNLNSFFV